MLGSSIRSQFPIFEQNPDLAYLDSAASAQKPSMVIDEMMKYLRFHHANIHRGALSIER